MSCAIAEPPTEVVGSADAVEIALRAERAAEGADAANASGYQRTRRLHEDQQRLLLYAADSAKSPDLRDAIRSAWEAKEAQWALHLVDSAEAELASNARRNGAHADLIQQATARYDRANAEWTASWEVMAIAAADILDHPIRHPDDLIVRHDAYLLILGTSVDPIGCDDENTELRALQSIKAGLAQLRTATCRVNDAAADFYFLVETQDATRTNDPAAETKAVTHMFAIESFAAGVWAESMAGLGFRLATLGTLADEIEDCAASDNEERQERATKAVEAVRDIAGNAITLLNLPVDHRVAVYYLGERNLRGAA